MTTNALKQEAHKLVDQLLDNATWKDLIQEIFVREAIENGLKDSDQENVKTVAEIRSTYRSFFSNRTASFTE